MSRGPAPAGLEALPGALRRSARPLALAAGESVFRLGTRPSRVFWVLGGDVRLVRHSAGGAQIVLQRASSGFVAEASLESARYHCDAVAAAPSRLLAFPIAAFRQALDRDARFRAFWMGRLAREVRDLRSRCERLALRGAAERIEHYIESEGRDGRVELSHTRKAWAAELGLTHEALYRALADLQRSGKIVSTRSGGVLVLTAGRPGTASPRRRLKVQSGS